METAAAAIVKRRKGINVRLILFLAFVSFPFMWFGYIFLNQMVTGGITQHGNYAEVDLKSLGHFPLDKFNGSISDVPSQWRQLDGKRVMLEGFMFARTESGPQVGNFEFVYNVSICCFGTAPLVQERVYAKVPGTGLIAYDPGTLTRLVGTLHVNVVKEAGIITSVYTLEVEKAEAV